jgi:hypothetical protein
MLPTLMIFTQAQLILVSRRVKRSVGYLLCYFFLHLLGNSAGPLRRRTIRFLL